MTTMMAITVADNFSSSLGDGAVPAGDNVVFVWLPITAGVTRGAVEFTEAVLSEDGSVVVVAGRETIDAAENMDR